MCNHPIHQQSSQPTKFSSPAISRITCVGFRIISAGYKVYPSNLVMNITLPSYMRWISGDHSIAVHNKHRGSELCELIIAEALSI